jgi:hypothetical protein
MSQRTTIHAVNPATSSGERLRPATTRHLLIHTETARCQPDKEIDEGILHIAKTRIVIGIVTAQ